MELCSVQSSFKLHQNKAFFSGIPPDSHLPKPFLSHRKTPLINTAGSFRSRSASLTCVAPRAKISDETSGGPSQYVDEKPDRTIVVEDVKASENNGFSGKDASEDTKEKSPVDELVQQFDVAEKLDNLKVIDGIHRMSHEIDSHVKPERLPEQRYIFARVLSPIIYSFVDLFLSFDIDDTGSILLYGGGAVIALWLTSALVGAIDSIPLIPKLLEVVGLAYTLWFTYRYLLFKKNRDELAAKIEDLKAQVLGSDDK